jgi:DNA-binding GntR family transcriptional regulator
MIDHKNISLADQVYEVLETDILSGKYLRGDLLTESKLCEQLGVSRTPIREALRRLLQENLIEESGKGSVVIGITENDLADIFLVRSKLESLAVEIAVAKATDEDVEKLKEVVELQEFYTSKQDADHIKSMDNKFHEMLYRIGGSTIFYEILVPLHKKIQKYRKASVESRSRATASVKEHRDIYEAIAERNTERASCLALEHINNAYMHILGKD